jgi:hypothetical protein
MSSKTGRLLYAQTYGAEPVVDVAKELCNLRPGYVPTGTVAVTIAALFIRTICASTHGVSGVFGVLRLLD